VHLALVPALLLTVAALVAMQLAASGAATPKHRSQHWELTQAAIAMVSVIRHPTTPPTPPTPPPPPTAPPTTTTTATTTAPRPAVVATPAAAPAPTPTPAPATGALPLVGQATAWGCAAAVQYLQAYAAPGFTLECPGYADGHAAMTCIAEQGTCPGTAVIAIADACPQAYMNEASNSWVLTGRSNAPIDPYGRCPA
jgi:hypothetical protein